MKFRDVLIFSVLSKGAPIILNAPSECPWKTASIHVKRSLEKRQELIQFIEGRESTDYFSHGFHENLTFSVSKISGLVRVRVRVV